MMAIFRAMGSAEMVSAGPGVRVRRSWVLGLGRAVVVLRVVAAVLTNYATESRPDWLADPFGSGWPSP